MYLDQSLCIHSISYRPYVSVRIAHIKHDAIAITRLSETDTQVESWRKPVDSHDT